MERKLRSWNREEQYPNSLFRQTPVTEAELDSEYLAMYRSLAEIYDPQGLAEEHCVEMMATALWCERRAISAETTAYNLDFVDQAREEQGLRLRQPEGYSAAEQMALAMARIARDTNFYHFLLRYKQTQARLFEAARRRLQQLKQDRETYERKLAVSDVDAIPYEESAHLERRMREHAEREKQNEPKVA